MQWIFLSPHLDDVAISCGGLVWELRQAGEAVSVWTICAGKPPGEGLSDFAQSLHRRWQTGVAATRARRTEDRRSARRMGAQYLHLDIPDCIYRRGGTPPRHLYASEEALFGPLDPAERPLVQRVARRLRRRLAAGAALVSPLGLGNHVDHQLTRQAAEAMGEVTWYYADYPYAHQAGPEIQALSAAGWQAKIWPVSEAGLQAWVEAVWAHQSQISTFWQDRQEVNRQISAWWKVMGGVRLWQAPELSRPER